MSTLWVYNSTPDANAESEYVLILGGTIPLLLFTAITVSGRLYVRIRTVRGIGADDWIIVVTMVCAIIYNAMTITQSRWGLGLPLELRPPEDLNSYSLLNYVGRPFYMVGILGFKVSLCFSYLRILSMGQPNYRLLVWIVMALCTLGHLIGTLVLMFSCDPIQRSWRPATTPGTCLPIAPLFYGLAVVTIIFDVVVFVLPIPFLSSLRMDIRKKIGIITAFALGLFTTGCSILRMKEINFIANGSGNSSRLALWGNIELDVGIILTCLPVLAPLLKVFGHKFSSYGKTGSSNPYLPTGSHNLQVFSNNRSHQHNTTTNANANASTRVAKSSRYMGEVSDNESQETILGKNQAEGNRRVETSADRRSSDESKNIDGIMRTMQVEVIEISGKTDSRP
ncbi:hypothetical protein EYC80_007172 [Monilinia laxa]|uniref:Rhodopsin domain-containing protein n=1 Tax=Monilinia laxa TaxID=61186 RepID=A0A5N6K0F6_MONLA|nr:hypothetical protein EYC80_007172 [Monilinia laxa]